MKTAVIMPTIRVPENALAWATLLNPATDVMVIAGNEISPHDDIVHRLDEVTSETGVHTSYLHPDSDFVRTTQIRNHLPVNHTNRRNLALLAALRSKPDVVVTIDDDNYPKAPTWLTGVHALLRDNAQVHRPLISSSTGWWNAGELCRPPVVHRGFPVSRWRERPDTTIENQPSGTPPARIGVVASLWIGDPDINAAERMVTDPEIIDITGSVVLAPGTWCPFDSQSTAVRGNLAPMLFMWPEVGRYDDIWSSYVMRAVMDVVGWHVTYGLPAVVQKRNPHKLIRDLKDEMWGYEHTEEFTDDLRQVLTELPADASGWSVMDVYYKVMSRLQDCTVVPGWTKMAFEAWLDDLANVLPPSDVWEVVDGPAL